jgi:fatty-acyl-CoA synthase
MVQRARRIESTMQDYPLTTTAILRHAVAVHPDGECVTWTGSGTRRAGYPEVAANAGRLAHALARLGVEQGDRVGTLCWNHQEHLEAYFAVPSMGAVLHTLNMRLPADQLVYIVNQGEARVILVDADLLPLVAALAPHLPGVEAFIVVGPCDATEIAGVPAHGYDALIAGESPDYPWPELDERSAAMMCFTSGTTGDPKGVVYSHRSTYLHALAGLTTSVLGSAETDRVLPIVPMFHVNAWGIPYGSLMAGASLLMPGRFLLPDHLTKLIEQERATMVSGVPTVLNWILEYGAKEEIDLSSLRLINSGGAAAPRSMIAAFRDRYGVNVVQGWGMTETSPLGGVAHPPPEVEPGSEADLVWRGYSARTSPGVEMRIVDASGAPLPRDGETPGELEVRGPWITGAYFGGADPDRFHDGWLRTGDIATLDRRGYMRITDRLKDVIKSGGEWISSVQLEDLLAGHPDVAGAAVIAIPDPKWDERPLACVVRRPGGEADAAALADFLRGKVARWQVPEFWAFVEELPLTTVGKFDKKVLRARHAAGQLTAERV